MAEEYPYMVSNNKIKKILDKIEVAQKPRKFSHAILKNLGFSSSNDRAMIPLLRRLGFIREDGTPTESYDQLKDKTKRFFVLGERVRELYSELYSINTEIHNASEDEIKGAISRVTGKDSISVNRYYATFKTLAGIAKFGKIPEHKKETIEQKEEVSVEEEKPKQIEIPIPGFHYNIQIHLPATTDISVYNAIFKSLKENLGI